MGNCSTRDHRDELYMRPAAPLVKGGTPSHHHQAPKRSGLKQIVLTAWTFDNFDLDLEGGDWRYAFSSSRAIKNGAWILVIRLLAAIAMLAYYHLELLEYMAFGLKFKAYAHFATWTDTVVLLYLLAALAVHYRALRLAGTPEPRAPAKTPWFISVTWALYAIALPMALTAFVLELLPEKCPL
ncbi:hypothetical protein T492DRAFT_869727 [Pavlovales sp. CCMP2436]|nr:hypothetical protein T492DRAFT_869727 [Pavlovales sp. CCMP2436]